MKDSKDKPNNWYEKHHVDPDMLGVGVWIVIFILLFFVFGYGEWSANASYQWVR